MNQTAQTEFNVWESALAQRMGVPRDDLRDFRNNHLEEGKHWANLKNRIKFSREGVSRAMDHMGIGESPQNDAEKTPDSLPPVSPDPTEGVNSKSEKNAAAAPVTADTPEQSVILTVVKAPLNRRIVMAEDSEKNECVIRVVDNWKFIPKMKVKCVHIERNVYGLKGRAPRWRGRW